MAKADENKSLFRSIRSKIPAAAVEPEQLFRFCYSGHWAFNWFSWALDFGLARL